MEARGNGDATDIYLLRASLRVVAGHRPQGSKKRKGGAMSEDSLLERVTAVAEERHLSQNTLTA